MSTCAQGFGRSQPRAWKWGSRQEGRSVEQYRSLKDHVYDHIAEFIDSGMLGGGDKVSEQQICDALGVSRTPVREALIQLAGDGCLEYLPRKGFRVKRVDDESAREIYEVLGPLDGRAAWLAVENLTKDDYSQLRFLCDSMDLAIEKGLLKKYDDLQHEFHNYYAQRCGNARLIGYITQLNRFFMKREYEGVDAETTRELLRKTNEEHKEIVRLLSAGERDRVQDYIRDVHWRVDNSSFVAW